MGANLPVWSGRSRVGGAGAEWGAYRTRWTERKWSESAGDPVRSSALSEMKIY